MGGPHGILLVAGAGLLLTVSATALAQEERSSGWSPSPEASAGSSAPLGVEDAPWAFLCAAIGVGGLTLVSRASLRSRRGPPVRLHVSRLSLAVDAESRASLDEVLASDARRSIRDRGPSIRARNGSEFRSDARRKCRSIFDERPGGRRMRSAAEATGAAMNQAPSPAQRLRQAVLALRRLEDRWCGVSYESAPEPLAPEAAARELARLGATAQGDDDGGVLVVHLLVAAHRAPHAPRASDRAEVRLALESRAALTASQLLGAEVRWTRLHDLAELPEARRVESMLKTSAARTRGT